LLGFEGARALNVLNTIDPSPRIVIPIVGVPGYRMEFPTYTLICNRVFFAQTKSEAHIRRAAAYDPYAVARTLDDIRREFPRHYLYVAPVGTRPHALGALMFASAHRDVTEVLFDHPRHTVRSRKGAGASHVFRVI